MKKITVFTIFCLNVAVCLANSIHPINAEHKPSAVTVYRSGALLTRTADVALKKGRNLIVFANIPDNINTGTIRMAEQAVTHPDCTIRSISWERATSTLYRNEEIRKLTAEKENLQQKILQKQDHVEVLTKTLSLLECYRTIHGEAVAEQAYTSGKDKTLWQSSNDTLTTRYRNAQTEKRNTEGAIRDLQEKLHLVDQKLRNHSEGVTARRISILVTADAKADCKATLKIAYVTHAASWTPRYQAKIVSGKKTMDLEYSGNVKQASGEKWEQIDLTLSTAPVRLSATPPEWKNWVLYGEPQQKGKSARKLVTVESADAAMPVAFAMYQNNTSGNIAKVNTKGDAASVSYTLPGKYTIADGNQESAFVITRRTFKTDYRNEAIPELRNNVFICGEFLNDSPYLLLPGKVAISRDSGYIGTSTLPLTAQGEKNKLYAGSVDGISVTSQKTQDKHTTEGLVQKTSCHYEHWQTTLLNTGNKPVSLILRQRIPVSEVEEVTVKLLPATTAGAELDPKTGMIHWNLTLQPGELKRLNLACRTAKKL
ncbi:MAG: mucoidy inhibitor MuiA family protein [Lentisphaeria bacterium]|nr:mucoidy inhibitor MuiA family protein [Lentisphaeria bacterium]